MESTGCSLIGLNYLSISCLSEPRAFVLVSWIMGYLKGTEKTQQNKYLYIQLVNFLNCKVTMDKPPLAL